MCGRYTLRKPGLLRKYVYQSEFEEFNEIRIEPRFNVAPSQPVPVVRLNAGNRRVVSMLRWGLVPSWTRGRPKTQPINARGETVVTSGMFRQAYERRLCLQVADGFYEWKGPKGAKVPYLIRRPGDGLLAFAGLWERWTPEDGPEPVETVCHCTTTPNAVMAPIHDRMPVVLHERDFDRWLSRDVPGADVADLLRPLPDEELEAFAVSTAVNDVRHGGPEMVQPS